MMDALSIWFFTNYRKKRLTDHWIRFIHPLKWRCRWLELQIKECQSRALEYDKELEQYEERKQHHFENFRSEDFNSRSHAFSGQLPKKNAMKRRKRKRIEETVDIASYMSNHNLFSYYGLIFVDFTPDIYPIVIKERVLLEDRNLTFYFSHADKRITADRTLTKDVNGNQGMTSGISSLVFEIESICGWKVRFSAVPIRVGMKEPILRSWENTCLA